MVESRKFEIFIIMVITINMILMMVQHYDQPPEVTLVLDILSFKYCEITLSLVSHPSNNSHQMVLESIIVIEKWLNKFMVQWLAGRTLDRAIQVQVLAGVMVLCPWAKNFTDAVPLFTHDLKPLSAIPSHPIPLALYVVASYCKYQRQALVSMRHLSSPVSQDWKRLTFTLGKCELGNKPVSFH